VTADNELRRLRVGLLRGTTKSLTQERPCPYQHSNKARHVSVCYRHWSLLVWISWHWIISNPGTLKTNTIYSIDIARVQTYQVEAKTMSLNLNSGALFRKLRIFHYGISRGKWTMISWRILHLVYRVVSEESLSHYFSHSLGAVPVVLSYGHCIALTLWNHKICCVDYGSVYLTLLSLCSSFLPLNWILHALYIYIYIYIYIYMYIIIQWCKTGSEAEFFTFQATLS
jgi:hypothetical protein